MKVSKIKEKLNPLNFRKYSINYQTLFCAFIVGAISVACFAAKTFIAYKLVALVLLLAVSVMAMLFDILPVLFAAGLSALIWNFVFIPPIFTFHINNPEDMLMFLLYFVIASVNAVLNFKIRTEEIKSRDKAENQKSIKLYNTLLNSLSHELRTPIATIIGAVDTIRDNKHKLTATNESSLLKEIHIASIRLNTQVENLLNMSRIESGMLKVKLEWCDMNELIHSILHKIDLDNHKTISFNANDSLPLFKLDIGLIETVIENLISNALHYTPSGTEICVSVELIYENCVITISDNGFGIPEDEIDYIFEKFYRVNKTKAGGTGLGLSIVKGFIDAHQGTVTAKNNKEAGVRFTINLPADISFVNKLNHE